MSMSEPSDLMQLKSYREAADKCGASIIGLSVLNPNSIRLQTRSLITFGIDCIMNLLDSSVVSRLDVILDVADAAGIPVFGSDVEQVKSGCLASASLDYHLVGESAGEQAAKILKGRKVADVPIRIIEKQSKPYYNSEVFGIFDSNSVSFPKSIQAIEDVAGGH